MSEEEQIDDEAQEKPEEIPSSLTDLDGLGAVTEKKLKGFGVTSLIDLCIRGAREIVEITGVAKAKADQWVFQAHNILEDSGAIRNTTMDVLDLMDYHDGYE